MRYYTEPTLYVVYVLQDQYYGYGLNFQFIILKYFERLEAMYGLKLRTGPI